VKSVTNDAFRRLYSRATKERQLRIRRSFRLWSLDPKHPSLRFKKVHSTMGLFGKG